ncbi:MAG: DUF2834 domain-containing protein [Leptolyngbyaceae cyanobacterium bins.59]|nr:DUF2834 domain-containing protein [Leptolyngbyaceae cyanobacterium bins.59]
MMRKIALGLLWLGFLTYAFLLAPPEQPGTFDLIVDLSTGKWEGINPTIVALFNIMGIWPLIYSGVLYSDGKGQRVPAWPFAVGSFGVGAFALLPYLVLRQPKPVWEGAKSWFIRLIESRWTGLIAFLGSLVLVIWGFTVGDWHNFVQQWQTDRFIHVMSLDFCLLHLLFPTLLGDDMARRGMQNSALFWLVTVIPLLGPALYLVVRPALPESERSTLKASVSG